MKSRDHHWKAKDYNNHSMRLFMGLGGYVIETEREDGWNQDANHKPELIQESKLASNRVWTHFCDVDWAKYSKSSSCNPVDDSANDVAPKWREQSNQSANDH